MGDMADWNIENGEEAYWRHQNGECGDDWCQYCQEEGLYDDDPDDPANLDKLYNCVR